MIGELTFVLRGSRHRARLTDSLAWECGDPAVVAMLSENWPAESTGLEDRETLGRHMLYRAAYRLGGEVRLEHSDLAGV
jgi:hypothetical protein